MESSSQNKKIKITFFSVLPPFRGGISSFSLMVIQHLKSSVELVPFTFSKLYPKFLFPGKSQTDSSLTGSYPRIVSTFNLWSYVGARNQLKKSKPDVLLVNYWMTIFAPMYAFFARGFKKDVLKVALIHNLVPHEKRFFDDYFNRIFLRRYDSFIVLSEQVKNELLNQKPNASVLLLSHPQYTHFGSPCNEEESRNSLGIPKKSKVLLFFGLIREYKGLDLLIQAMNFLDESYYLMIAGEIYGDEGTYEKLISKCKNPNIILKNAYLPDEDVKYYFSAADLCVLPYKKGTQSGVQAIADSFSVPVLVSKNGGLHENLDDGKNGFVLNDLHVENLAQKIRDIFSGGKIDIVRNRLNSIQTQKENEWEKFTEDLLEFIKTEKEKIKI